MFLGHSPCQEGESMECKTDSSEYTRGFDEFTAASLLGARYDTTQHKLACNFDRFLNVTS